MAREPQILAGPVQVVHLLLKQPFNLTFRHAGRAAKEAEALQSVHLLHINPLIACSLRQQPTWGCAKGRALLMSTAMLKVIATDSHRPSFAETQRKNIQPSV